MLRSGRRTRSRTLDLFVSPSPVARLRVGLVVPRYHFRIVDRNRVKRRLREAVRLELLPRCRAGSPFDVLVRARAEAYDTPFSELTRELARFAGSLCSSRS